MSDGKTRRRVQITHVCWIPNPDALRCTLEPNHARTEHYHWPTRTSWPRRPGETQ